MEARKVVVMKGGRKQRYVRGCVVADKAHPPFAARARKRGSGWHFSWRQLRKGKRAMRDGVARPENALDRIGQVGQVLDQHIGLPETRLILIPRWMIEELYILLAEGIRVKRGDGDWKKPDIDDRLLWT